MFLLTKLREKRGWNKQQLAREAELAASDLSRIEMGKMAPYKPQQKRIANALDVPAEELFKKNDFPRGIDESG